MSVGEYSDQAGCKVVLYTFESVPGEGTEHSLDAYETLTVEEPACDSISDCQDLLLLVSRDMAARSEAGVVDSPRRLHLHLQSIGIVYRSGNKVSIGIFLVWYASLESPKQNEVTLRCSNEYSKALSMHCWAMLLLS